MEKEYAKLSDYYLDQASRVTTRAKLAPTQEHPQALLVLAGRWEKLARSVGSQRLPRSEPRPKS